MIVAFIVAVSLSVIFFAAAHDIKLSNHKYVFTVLKISAIFCFIFIILSGVRLSLDLNTSIPAASVLPTPVSFQKKITPIFGCVNIPILTYHYVEYVTDEKDTIRQSLNINPDIFENQVKTLKENGYQMYFVSDIPKILAGEVPYASKSAVLTFDDGHWDFVTDVLPILKKYNAKATVYIIVNYLNGSDFMSEDQLKELTKEPLVEIGSHTLSHNSLASASASWASKEISESKQKLEQLLGIKINSFAYPYGGYNRKDEEILKNALYTAAVSTKKGVCQSNDRIFDLYRIKAGRLTDADFIRFIERPY